MEPGEPGVRVLHVRHESRVAAIRTAAGAACLLQEGLAERIAATGVPVEVVEVECRESGSSEVAEAFAVAGAVAQQVRHALEEGLDVVVLSGSCHMGLGAVAGLPRGGRGVVWLDAHGDFNTPETSWSGLLDGMTLATITGRCWNALAATVPGFTPVLEDRVVMAGVRDLDPAEADLLEGSAVAVLTAERASAAASDVLRALGVRVDAVYLHVDLDVLDPSVGLANAFATPGGFSAAELRSFLGEAGRLCPVRVLGLASYDPEVDRGGGVARAAVEAVVEWAEARAVRAAR
jgi:arginase